MILDYLPRDIQDKKRGKNKHVISTQDRISQDYKTRYQMYLETEEISFF